MTSGPGYLVLIRAFVPADPTQPSTMADAAERLNTLAQMGAQFGLKDAKMTYKFILRHGQKKGRSPPKPPEET